MSNIKYGCLLLLAHFGAAGPLTAQSTTACCTLEDSLAQVVSLEAAHLSRADVYAQGGPWVDSIELPPELLNTYYEAICAVRNEHSAITDSLFAVLHYSYHPSTSVDMVEIGVDKNEPWYLKLRDSSSPTGYAPLDSLISAYELTVTYIYEGNNSANLDYVFFRAGRYLNVEALSRAFEALDGVGSVSPSGGAGDGDRLEGAVFPNFTSLLFSIGSGDCPSGCTDRSFYEFRVYPDCGVEFCGPQSVHHFRRRIETAPAQGLSQPLS